MFRADITLSSIFLLISFYFSADAIADAALISFLHLFLSLRLMRRLSYFHFRLLLSSFDDYFRFSLMLFDISFFHDFRAAVFAIFIFIIFFIFIFAFDALMP